MIFSLWSFVWELRDSEHDDVYLWVCGRLDGQVMRR